MLSIAESNPELLIREDDICCFKRATHGRERLGTLACPMPRQVRVDIQRRYRRRPPRLWCPPDLWMSQYDRDIVQIPAALLGRLADTVCYAA